MLLKWSRLSFRLAAAPIRSMTTNQPRAPRGRPAGGSWTDRERDDGDVTLANNQARTPEPSLVELTPAAQSVVDAIADAGGRPLIVGGSVRDALLQARTGRALASKDIDIEAYGLESHQQLLEALSPLGHVDERGVVFGVVSAVVDGEEFDVSLPRRDSVNGEGHRGFDVAVDPGLDERTAFGRRDFTLNALGWDPLSGELIDHYGGRADLDAGILRHTTTAYSEDPLRVLRGAQFAGRFGFDMAEETQELSRSISDRYTELSRERVWGEWRKIARRGVDITRSVRVLEQTEWLRHFPALAATRGTEQDIHWHPEGDVLTHLGFAADSAATAADRDGLDGKKREVIVLAALLHDVGKPATTVRQVIDGQERITSAGHAESGVPIAKQFLTDIGVPQEVADKVLPLIDEHMSHISTNGKPSTAAVRRLIRRLDNGGSGPTIYDWARVVDADIGGRGALVKESPSAAWIAVAERVGPVAQKSLLTGKHLAAAGYAPGPGWSEVIAAAVRAQDEGEFQDEAGAAAWFARRKLAPVGLPARPSARELARLSRQ